MSFAQMEQAIVWVCVDCVLAVLMWHAFHLSVLWPGWVAMKQIDSKMRGWKEKGKSLDYSRNVFVEAVM